MGKKGNFRLAMEALVIPVIVGIIIGVVLTKLF